MTRKTKLLAIGGMVILAAQAIASYGLKRDPFLPSPPTLSVFPLRVNHWVALREVSIDPAALEMLGPDDTLSREYYAEDENSRAYLFVAYYKTQLRAKQAHDPKVCLPGNGWNPLASRLVSVPIASSRHSFPANYYRIRKENEEAIVIYWFQTHKDVYPLEQQLRVHRLLDAISENRTDMALVRIVVPVGSDGLGAAESRAIELSKSIYPVMLPYFPASPTSSNQKPPA